MPLHRYSSKPLIPSVYLLHRTKENLQLLLELNDRRGSDPWLVTLGRKKSRNVSKSLSRFNFYSPFDEPITFLFPSLSLFEERDLNNNRRQRKIIFPARNEFVQIEFSSSRTELHSESRSYCFVVRDLRKDILIFSRYKIS